VQLNWLAKGEQLALSWSERCGPPIAGPPESSGFGTRLSHSTIVGQLGGELSYEWSPDGMSVVMTVPLLNLAR
jgi:two-component sensor histidine kinase